MLRYIVMLSIPQWCDCDFFESNRRSSTAHAFNPTMVRLRRSSMTVSGVSVETFNPTMVRLRRSDSENVENTEQAFQSHNGAIATLLRWAGLLVLDSFNPTMVRLRLFKTDRRSSAAHTFNPTMVRLRPPASRQSRISLTSLSIPQWCDCDPARA